MTTASPSGRTVGALLAAAVVALAACAGGHAVQRTASPAPVAERRLFEVSGHGALEISVPPGWKAFEGSDTPATIHLQPAQGGAVALLVPQWNAAEAPSETERVEAAEELADRARCEALETSVEPDVPLHDLVGEGVRGFWFAVTDAALTRREPRQGEWRHLLQGVAAVGPLTVSFALLDDAPGPHRFAMLDVVRGARHVPAASARGVDPAAAGGFVLDGDAVTSPLAVALPDRTWSILVDLPGFRMFEPRSSDGGLLVLGHDPRTGLVASVHMRPAAGAANARACRERALERIQSAAPDLADLRTSDAGPSARAAYTLAEMPGRHVRQEHAHAWLLRDGVCVSVHASKAEPAPGDSRLIEAILDSVRFGEGR